METGAVHTVAGGKYREMMTVLSGSVTLTDPESGNAETSTASDTFFVPKGTPCIWGITETLRKCYMIAA